MVLVFIILTVLIFLTVDLIVRREDKKIKENEKSKKSPIFLSPERALQPLNDAKDRMNHLSHTWASPSNQGYVYIGFDNFISTLFTSQVKIKDLPIIGSHVPQGAKIWKIEVAKHGLAQLAPISGQVIDINPACKMNLPLLSEQIEKSWIIKMKADDFKRDSYNLMTANQTDILNIALKDELYLLAQKGQYLNDGGKIDPDYIATLDDEEWSEIKVKFFHYDKSLSD